MGASPFAEDERVVQNDVHHVHRGECNHILSRATDPVPVTAKRKINADSTKRQNPGTHVGGADRGDLRIVCEQWEKIAHEDQKKNGQWNANADSDYESGIQRDGHECVFAFTLAACGHGLYGGRQAEHGCGTQEHGNAPDSDRCQIHWAEATHHGRIGQVKQVLRHHACHNGKRDVQYCFNSGPVQHAAVSSARSHGFIVVCCSIFLFHWHPIGTPVLECGSTGVLDCRDLRKSLDSMRQNAFDGLPLSPMAQRAYPHYSNSPSLHHSSILCDATDL